MQPMTAQPKSVTAHYSATAKTLHWLVFALIAFVGAVGLLFDEMSRGSKDIWLNIHAIIGLLILALVFVRLAWRWQNPAPPLPQGTDQITRITSSVVHGLLYVMMIALPLIGAVAYFYRGRSLNFGLFQLGLPIVADRAVSRPSTAIHETMAYVLFAIVGLHILAALWHHFIRKDGILRRMLPGN